MVETSTSSSRISFELRVHECWRERNYEGVRTIADQGMEAARNAGDEEAWWNLLFIRAQSLRETNDFQECATDAQKLQEHPLTASSPGLEARVSTLLSAARHGCGRLQEAITEARRAVEAANRDSTVAEVRIDALQALIAALAESGHIQDAWRHCRTVSELLTASVNPQTAGKANWVIGNVAFLRGKLDDAVAYHRKAASELSPMNDLQLWARFNRASAHMRLAAGLAGEETLEFIDRAEIAESIVQGGGAEQLQLNITRAHWLLVEGRSHDAAVMLQTICQSTEPLATHTTAEAHVLLGEALHQQGQTAQGIKEITIGEALFRDAGADHRAKLAQETIDKLRAS